MVNRMRKMKESGIPWIGVIPESWDLKPMKAILKERKENNDPIKTNNILSLTIEQGVIPISEKKGVGGNKPKNDLSKYRLAYPGDIVINSMNILAGAVGISEYFGVVSPVYYTLLPRTVEYTSKYYHDVFQTKPFQQNLLGLGNGIMMKKSESSGKLNTIRMRIPMSKLGPLLLPTPSLEEQIKMTNYLNKKAIVISSIIEKTKETLEEYRSYKESLIVEVITKGLNSDVELKDSDIEWIGNIPKHWDVTIVKHVLRKLDRQRKQNGKTVICSNHGISKLLGNESTGLISLTQHDYQGVEVGDLLIHGMDTWHGAIAISEYDGDCTSVVHVCETKQNKTYIEYYLKMLAIMKVYKVISNGVRGNTSDFRSWKKAGEIQLVLPPIDEQDSIANYISTKIKDITKVVKQKEDLLAELESYKKALTYEVVTGKKDIQ